MNCITDIDQKIVLRVDSGVGAGRSCGDQV
jgi:hypothetical protein